MPDPIPAADEAVLTLDSTGTSINSHTTDGPAAWTSSRAGAQRSAEAVRSVRR